MPVGTTWALVIFVVICALNAVALIVDDALREYGYTTFTDHVRRNPLLGVPLVALQAMATIALAYHLWVSK